MKKKYLKLIALAAYDAKDKLSGTSFIQTDEEFNTAELKEIEEVYKNTLIAQSKISILKSSIFDGKSTTFVFTYKYVSTKDVFKALTDMEEIANNYCNMHGTPEESDQINQIISNLN